MKKIHTLLYIIPFFMVLSNIPSLYALQGFAIVDSGLRSGEITVDDKLNFPLNDGVYVRNLRTGEGTWAIVGNWVHDSSIEARLSKEIAGKIGISESEGGIIELLSLEEATARGYIDPGVPALAQGSSTLPPKETSLSSPGASNTGKKTEAPPPSSPGNGTPSIVASPIEPSSASSTTKVPDARDNQEIENKKDLVKPDVPETTLPLEPRSSSLIAAGSSPIKDMPVPGKNLETPETNLPKVPVSGNRNESSPTIQDTPAINDIKSSSNEEIAVIEDNPQISIPPPPIVTKNDGSFKINEEPVLENALVTPETNLPDRNPVFTKGDESPTIQDAPAVAEITMAPEITLPVETLWNTRDREEPRINEAPTVNTTSSTQGDPWSYPEITLPAENLSSTSGSEDPRIKETPTVNTPSLAQTPPRSYNSDEYDLALVPAEKRPPAERDTVTLPPEAEIAPISKSPKSVMSGLSPEEEIPPVSNNLSGTSGRNSSAYLDPTLAIAPLENGQSRNPTPSPSSVQGSRFSVPLITTLEKGKYYVQLAAFSKSELIELELSKIGKSYPLAIQTIGSQEHPLYRILLGPMNLGESGALLQRFKGIYKDAFVRQGS